MRQVGTNINIPISMVAEFEDLRQRKRTFARDLPEFMRHWIELEILVLRNPDARDYAIRIEAILRPLSRLDKPLTKAAARRKNKDQIGPFDQRRVPNYILDQVDDARRHPWMKGITRDAFVRLCLRRGLDVLGGTQ